MDPLRKRTKAILYQVGGLRSKPRPQRYRKTKLITCSRNFVLPKIAFERRAWGGVPGKGNTLPSKHLGHPTGGALKDAWSKQIKRTKEDGLAGRIKGGIAVAREKDRGRTASPPRRTWGRGRSPTIPAAEAQVAGSKCARKGKAGREVPTLVDVWR